MIIVETGSSQAENIGKLLPSIGQAYRQVYACWVQFEKDSGNFNARWTWNIEMVLSLSFFLLFHCSSNSIKLWNNCNSFIQSRDRCNFMKLVKNIEIYRVKICNLYIILYIYIYIEEQLNFFATEIFELLNRLVYIINYHFINSCSD